MFFDFNILLYDINSILQICYFNILLYVILLYLWKGWKFNLVIKFKLIHNPILKEEVGQRKWKERKNQWLDVCFLEIHNQTWKFNQRKNTYRGKWYFQTIEDRRYFWMQKAYLREDGEGSGLSYYQGLQVLYAGEE